MRSGPERKLLAAPSAALAAALVLGACATADSSAIPADSVAPSGSAAAEPTAAGASRAAQPTGTPPGPATPALPEPGTPYVATDLLQAMRDSRRPGGVPDRLETEAIAAVVAAELWTYDGSRWPSIVAGGSCGPEACTLEIGGTPAGSVGEDLYIFSVDLAGGAVTRLAAELRGLPSSTAEALDQYARDLWPEAPVPGPMASARWLPPPDEGVFVLSYRAGGEEGSPAVDAVVDVSSGRVELRQPG